MVAVRLFGPLAVDVNGRLLGPRDFGGRKPKQLLEVLLVQRGRAVPKEEIAELIWGDSLPRNVAATLETYASVARSHLGPGRELIVTEPGAYRFDAAAVEVDLDRFDELLRQAAAAPAPARRAALERALAVVRGAVLEDEPYGGWALDVRGVYEERRLQAICDLAELCLGLGDALAALDRANEALALDGVRERAHRAAMLAHYALGDEDRALMAYERCRAVLDDALGSVPTRATTDLHAAILQRADPATLLPSLRAGAASADEPPPTRYARHRDVSLAYQTLGTPPPDLVFAPGFASHVEAAWEDPAYSGFMRRLAAAARLIVFDKRGTGLSDPVVEWPALDERAADVLAVMDAAGAARAVLFGVSEGGPMCALAAARHPGRVAGLILHASFSRILREADNPWGWTREFFEAYLAAFEDAWTTGAGLEVINPSLAADPAYIRWFARYLRLSASPGTMRRLMRLNAEIDIEELLPEIRVPTLILHRRDDRWVAVENSRHLASRIPHARLVELPGVDHQPWIGDADPIHRAIGEFLAGL